MLRMTAIPKVDEVSQLENVRSSEPMHANAEEASCTEVHYRQCSCMRYVCLHGFSEEIAIRRRVVVSVLQEAPASCTGKADDVAHLRGPSVSGFDAVIELAGYFLMLSFRAFGNFSDSPSTYGRSPWPI